MEGGERNIRSLRKCARTVDEFRLFNVPESEFGCHPVDILVPGSNPPRCPSGFKPHKQCKQLPSHALYPLWDGMFVVSPELCFVEMCQSLTFIEALELGMELCGTYALRPEGLGGMTQRDYALIDAETLRRHLQSWRGLKGLPLARKVSRHLITGSASPMETKLYLLLCLPLQYGGYNLGHPELNLEMQLDSAEMEILRHTKVKPDMLWRQQKLIVEYDGSQHEEERQSKYDAMRITILEAKGHAVRRVKRHQLYSPLAFDSFASSTAALLGVRRRPITLKHQLAREELRRVLLGVL